MNFNRKDVARNEAHRNGRSGHQFRRGAVTVGLGTAAVALSQLVAAPAARADDFADIVANVDASVAAGQADFTTGQADFALGTQTGFAEGVANDVAGLDNILIGPGEDVIAGLIQTLAGQTPTPGDDVFLFGPVPDPQNLYTFQTELSVFPFINILLFVLAGREFTLGTPAGFADGLTVGLDAFNVDAVIAPAQALLGLADLAGL
ncbi:hypothetical protein [Mycobacterium sp.]|uniref:hypothetical protein n=1 Tax=Mycobacterium sp. TaxID=1785 RepID=UPI001282BD99|nr:hypothetical protein [Mycobacterium sp.]KAA8957704.1 MAG: hypothetical protein F6Q13_16240 [Mycobacterium sp.]